MGLCRYYLGEVNLPIAFLCLIYLINNAQTVDRLFKAS